MVRYLVCFFLYALTFSVQGRDTLRINGADHTQIYEPHLSFRTSNQPDTIWRTIHFENTILKPLTVFEGKAFFKSASDKSLVLEWPDNKIEKLDAYVTNSKGDTCAYLNFNDIDGYHAQLLLKNQVMILHHPDTNETYKLYYKLSSHNPAYVICWARNIDAFLNRFIKEYSWYGIFSGMVLIIFSLNVLFFAILRDKTFLWYALYTISLGIFHWSYTGIGFQWIWPNLTIWNRYAYIYSSFLMLSMQFIYFRSYIKNLIPINNWYIRGVILVRILILTISIFNTGFIEWYFMFDFFTFSYLLFLLLKIKLFQTLHGKMFITSISLLLSSYLIFILAYYHIIPSGFLAYNSLAMGGSLELLIGLLALALRFKFLSDEKNKLQVSEIISLTEITVLKDKLINEVKEKERIQKEINKELEIKIAERTQELAKKNEDLEKLNIRLNEISSSLDKQNWSLNQELSSDRIKLMWGKKISFAEFIQTFPADKNALRFIADLKWQDGYICKKCGSTDWSEGTQYYARKCNQCKYEESVTANTLFHGVKFPLTKALYISLTTVINRDSISVKQIALEIDLREATVWAFRKKTLDKIEHASNNKGEILKCLVQ
ncbi:7TM-DISM domain-containing protein [Cytophaga aurantiaca]|uniref:7TM-DISM domain-containing protein n=1 Tax=Cytophaga aurantiaca TaxID=29530 RepID=UPI0003718274|nr:7TM-DISM domain-containing protein [Cytophaga aurantiaca]